MKAVKAVVVEGHRVASGGSWDDLRFPLGTIRMQEPFFKEKGFDLQAYFNYDFVYATLNLSIAPLNYSLGTPQYSLNAVKWTDAFPPENFFLSSAAVSYEGRTYKALIYMPDPATKPDHFHDPSVIEVIAQRVIGIRPGDEVTLVYPEEAIIIAS